MYHNIGKLTFRGRPNKLVKLAPSGRWDTYSLSTKRVKKTPTIGGRTISVPITWFPSLSSASPAQLQDWEILGDGEGIHWPQLDEDLSVDGLLLGNRGRI